MAEKKQAAAVKKPAAAAKAKAPAKKKTAKGSAFECVVCGLAVVVDEDCGCVDACDIICCGEPMKEKKVKVK